MSDEAVNLTHEYLKRFDKKLDRIGEDIHDIKFRMGTLERSYIGIQDILTHHNSRFDRIEERLDRIEKRLDLVEA